jgi:hypothetical protein
VIGRRHHLHESRLVEHYMIVRNGDSVDPAVAAHLADCAACARQFDDLALFMDALRAEGDAEVEARFPADRLAAQRDHIAARLEHIGHAARVLSFPAHGPARTPVLRARFTARWLPAAAAAAGLFVGAALGTLYSPEPRAGGPRPAAQGTAATGTPAPAAATTPSAAAFDEEAFLNELDFAVEGPRTRELMLFDALTPSIREIRVAQSSY